MDIEGKIKQKAVDLGFELVGITNAAPLDPTLLNSFSRWIDAGCVADMHYMKKNIEKRFDPQKLLPNAKSIICFGLNYKPPELNAEQKVTKKRVGKIVSYALYEDYHQFIKNKLRWFVVFLNQVVGQAFDFKICVDSVPIAERALAQRAGVGFIAKNHMLMNPDLGCQIFLAEIITNLDLKSDNHFKAFDERTNEYLPSITCSGCSKCAKACPTGALKKDGSFDARLCISYLTIEHKGSMPSRLKTKIEDRIFGCEQCLLVCPYQKNAPVCSNKDFRFHPERAQVNLQDVFDLTEQEFDSGFADSAIHRIGLDKLKRNAVICMENVTKNKDCK
ncbi:MAG: tRNA epoxyqueuosine(34) reductase QueG [Planctomycetota bacterium]|jgi:epoxyqueuosine reductase